MLKYLNLNNQRMPVPVPIRNLDQALCWVSETFVREGEMLTAVYLDGKDLTESALSSKKNISTLMDEHTDLVVKVDSAEGLATQSLDVLGNMVLILKNSIKNLVINCWQTPATSYPQGLEIFVEDLRMLLGLGGMLTGNEYCSLENIQRSLEGLQLVEAKISDLSEDSDYRGIARILLNALLPKLEKFHESVDSAQSSLFSQMAARTMQNHL